MRKDFLLRALVGSICLGWPMLSFAHTEDAGTGFLSGLLHPVMGVDHFLAMLAVGIVSAQLGGRRIWTIPCIFVSSMVLGAVPGTLGTEFPFVEVAIAFSVIILGIAISIAKENGHGLLTAIFVSFFGIFHGHAHGLEMPNTADPAFYGFGFLLGTAAIHVLGVLIGHLFCQRDNLRTALRYVGAAMALTGVVILSGVLV